jgi:hypothetical protein
MKQVRAHGAGRATKLSVTLGRRVLFAVVVALAAACASPTLPLPPPEVSSAMAITGSNPSKFHIVGTSEPNAEIYIRNMNTTGWPDPAQQVEAALADDKGAWAADVFAFSGDYLTIDQNHGDVLNYTVP